MSSISPEHQCFNYAPIVGPLIDADVGAMRGALTTAPPARFAPQIARLMPQLAPEHDGEVVARPRALDMNSKAAGCHLHDLLSAIEKVRALHKKLQSAGAA